MIDDTTAQFEMKRLKLPQDRELLVSIHKIYDQEYGFHREDTEYEILVDYLSKFGEIYHPLVLRKDSETAGYIRAYDRLSTSSCDIVLMLDLVYIMPHFRGQGLGKILMQKFIDYAIEKQRARIDLLTDHDNPAAVKLYESAGFKGRDRHQMILFIKKHDELLDYFKKRCESR